MTRRRLRVLVIVALFLFNGCAMPKAGDISQGQAQRQILLFAAERAIRPRSGNRFRFVEKQNTESLPTEEESRSAPWVNFPHRV